MGWSWRPTGLRGIIGPGADGTRPALDDVGVPGVAPRLGVFLAEAGGVLAMKKWLQGYLNEFVWRYNHRRDDRAMFLTLIARSASA